MLAKALRTEGETAPLQLATSLTEALDLAIEAAGPGPPRYPPWRRSRSRRNCGLAAAPA